MTREYYSTRQGRSEGVRLSLEEASSLLVNVFEALEGEGAFQKAFGYDCVDGGTKGFVGRDPGAYFHRKLRKPGLWPIREAAQDYTEDDLFDVIELLHDLVAKPLNGRYHSYADCGWHYSEFDEEAGRLGYRDEVNRFLGDYDSGFQISEDGEVIRLAPDGLEDLVQTPLVTADPTNVDERVQSAIRKFRRRGSTPEDQLDAVRDLAAVLEFLRPKAKQVLATKDEADLFNIANNFAIRHHNERQLSQYDREVWLPWIFYYYLATIHAILQLASRAGS
ncbi:MAG: hypothetical protein V3T76_08985 [candidate division NC10 bacterium]